MEKENKAAAQKNRSVFGNIAVILVMFSFMLVSASVLSLLFNPLAEGFSEGTKWIMQTYLFAFIGYHLFFLIYTFFTDREIFWKYLKKSKGNNLKNFLIGIFFGFGLNGLCILIAYLHGDVVFMQGNMTVFQILLGLICIFVQSSAEELMMRGYIYYYTEKNYGKILAVILSAVIFSLMHAFNKGITVLALLNLALMGLLCVLCVYLFDSLWMAMALHTAWNFTQNFIFGLPNSGFVSPVSILKLEAAKESLVFDPVFGVEAVVSVTVVLIVSCAALYLIFGKKKEKAEKEKSLK